MSTPLAQVYEFGAFRVDARKRLLLDREGRQLPLTPKAFDTLLFLLENRDTVVSKEALMRAVWPRVIVEENNLNQNVSAIRRALGETRGENRFIATIPGRGYRFVAEVGLGSSRPQSAPGTPSGIAVLPFVPLVPEHGEPALELGMADTLISRLSRIRQLVVRPIGAVRKFTDPERDAIAAGRELGVSAIVDGSIQRWGDTIRVSARLMQVGSGTAIWSGTFDEKFSDIFAVEDAICERIATELTITLQPEERARLNRRYTDKPEVYELFLKGRLHFTRLTPPEMLKAIDHFQRALRVDPGYAPAYLGIASAEFRLPLAGEMAPLEHYPKARQAALQALEIDNQLAEGHAILGWVRFWFEWNWLEAEESFRRAREIDPNEVEGHLGYAHMMSNTGRHDLAIEAVRRARELNPVFLLANALEGQFLLNAGRIDEAEEVLLRACDLDARFWLNHMYLSNVYFERHCFEDSLAHAEQAVRYSGGAAQPVALAICALARMGREDEARFRLGELLERSGQRYVPPFALAQAWLALGDQQQAFQWLDRGLDQRDPRMTFLKVDPRWALLRGEPRFETLLRQLQLAA